MKTYWIWLVLLLLATGNLQAQDEEKNEEKPSLKERLYYSGGFDLQFGNITVIGFYPSVGYKFNQVLSLGAGLSYQFTKYRSGSYISPSGIPYSVANSEPQHTYGGKIFGRAKTPINVFVHTEWESLNIFLPVVNGPNARNWYNAYLIGGGYSMALGGGASSLNIMMLYNLNRSSTEALYRSEFVPRIEFSYNF
jgi:hypothetical protein